MSDTFPFSATIYSPILIFNFLTSTGSPDFPRPIAILPQLGSSPATAVFTKGELAIEKAIFFALPRDFALITLIVKNFFAPSPSTTTCLARLRHNFFNANSNF